MKRIPKNPNQDKIKNFLAVTNAYAEQQRQLGEPTEFIQAANAGKVYEKMLKLSIAANDISHTKHAQSILAIKNSFPNASREAIEMFSSIGEKVSEQVRNISEVFVKNGMTIEKAVESAFNSLAGNPVYDHFGNLNLLSSQLYEEQVFVNSFIDSGDAFNMPIESGGDGTSISRFRSPTEQISGSGKTYQGDINPQGYENDDTNRISISLFNEFKNVKWLEEGVNLSSAQRDQILMYENAVAPALAGFLIQQRLIDAAQKVLMKQAELLLVGGLDQANSYIPNVGGSYGLLSSNILHAKSDAGDATPQPITGAEWRANPTKLIQKITNCWYKPNTPGAQLPILDSSLMYKELVRLFALPAAINVDLQPKEWVLFVPSSWYALATQYPSSGTFNKQLQEMITSATAGKIVGKIRVETSSLLNYGANVGTGTNAYNYMVLMAMGSPVDKKAVVMPGQTTIPTVIALPSSSSLMRFRVQYATGGIMVKQFGGCFVLEFSNAS